MEKFLVVFYNSITAICLAISTAIFLSMVYYMIYLRGYYDAHGGVKFEYPLLMIIINITLLCVSGYATFSNKRVLSASLSIFSVFLCLIYWRALLG